MEGLRDAVRLCPIVDHHAHNLLVPSELGKQSLLSATSEANGAALRHARSTLAHLRAVAQLAAVLRCEPTLAAVERRLVEERSAPGDAWAIRCFEGIATVLIDDGLNDGARVQPYSWHDRLVPHPCRRIVRIEVVAQDIMLAVRREKPGDPGNQVNRRFLDTIWNALDSDSVAGFKSVICYRTGLDVPDDIQVRIDKEGLGDSQLVLSDHLLHELNGHIRTAEIGELQRLQHKPLSAYFVHLTMLAMEMRNRFKPFQFHTGLGDNDIRMSTSSAALLQPLIAKFPKVPFVLLHASYPFTREAGYLASVYENCYLDIGEVFPMVSMEGQERVIRDALEVTPTEKLCWSTDGHWMPETYLLAVIQVREGLEKVLVDYVRSGALTVEQAARCAQDILYNTSAGLYDLSLPPVHSVQLPRRGRTSYNGAVSGEAAAFQRFHETHPEVRYLHLQYLDYTASRRGRVVPIERAKTMIESKEWVGIQRGIFRQLQNDSMAPGTVHQGEWCLKPCLDSLFPTSDPSVASVQCEIQFKDGRPLSHDPRTILRRTLETARTVFDLEFTAGFEIEVVFMQPVFDSDKGTTSYVSADLAPGHAWSSAPALEAARATSLVRDILDAFGRCGVALEQYHAEGAKSQYEFVLAPLPALRAADTVLAARAAIAAAAEKHGLRATLVPKAYGAGFGTGAHVHLSMQPQGCHESFYAGVMKHMRGLLALAMPQPGSYERQGDGLWSGGTWVCWGDQNRECCLRRIKGSHWECKVMDGYANVYLALAGLIGAGVQGVRDGEVLTGGSVDGEPASLTPEKREALGISEKLPTTLEEALQALQDDQVLTALLGETAMRSFVDVKQAEMAWQRGVPAQKVRDWYMERY